MDRSEAPNDVVEISGILQVSDLNLPDDFKYRETPETHGPTCTICSDCCMCETGGV